MNLQPNVKISQKGFFSKNFSEYIFEFANSLDSLDLPISENYLHYLQNSNPTKLICGNVPVSEKENAHFEVFAGNIKKLNKDYFCDLGILLKSAEVSGHNFLPLEVREGSPLYGSLSIAMGGKENLMQGPVKDFYEFLKDKFSEFKETIEKLPMQENSKFFPMVHVYHS